MTAQHPSDTPTKDELLASIRDGLLSLEGLVDSIPPDDLTRPLTDWSVKDHLAHIVSWEQRALAAVMDQPAHQVMGISEAAWARDEHDINAALHALHVVKTVDEVRNEWRSVHASLVGAVEGLTDEELSGTVPNSKGKLVDVIAGNTYEHYEEHEGWIREQLGRS
jgi:hypothetical protein